MDNISYETYKRLISNGYKPVAFVQNTIAQRTAAINLGLKFNFTDHVLSIKFGQDDISNGMPCGTDDNVHAWLYSYTANGNIVFSYVYSSTANTIELCPQDTKTHTFKYVGGQNGFDIYFDGRKQSVQEDFGQSVETEDNICVFGRPGNPYLGKIHYFVLSDSQNNVLVSLQPARRISDGEIGFYNLVNDSFLTASVADAYVAGPDITVQNPAFNQVFPILDEDGNPFHNLSLKKATYDSVVMSLGDKITGDVYYKGNALDYTMKEYIVFKGVKYSLVNPPTITLNGMVSDGSDKGLTKYSFEFYHPMAGLSNMPFTDVAVSSNELRYKSQDKTFAWAGYLKDFIDKLNKNLENTEWVVMLSDSVSQDTLKKFSEVLSFDKNTIADALKTAYDTWNVPFIIDSIDENTEQYDFGKRFLILFGLPSNELYISEESKRLDVPYVFRFGQGVGLKNNSATPRNNKIITRIAGCGNTTNVPFGYPQIPWGGDPTWEYTINNDPNNPNSYPIYKGIYNGGYVALIKHPFTRTNLMPAIYAETVNKKVNPYADGYNPDGEIIDYYDAENDGTYPNPINPIAPSYEFHEFDIKPELGVERITGAWPINNAGEIEPYWIDDMDENGNYKQSYFKIALPILDFDLYACAAITEEMHINMRSGACIGCTFTVQVDWDDYKLNFYDTNGNFAPNGPQRNLEKYPKSNLGRIDVIVQKDIETFGTLMPNRYQVPKGSNATYEGDQFVILGISLPATYITNAQTRLDEAMKEYMLENNVYYFDYPLSFDEKFLAKNVYLLQQIRNNSIVRFLFGQTNVVLYVKQYTIKFGESALPQYSITLTDDVEIVLNQIGQVTEDVSRMRVDISALQNYYSRNFEREINGKLSKISDDTAAGHIRFLRGLSTGDFVEDSTGAAIYKNDDGNWVLEGDYFHVRKKLTAETVEILHSSHIGGKLIATAGTMVVARVEIPDAVVVDGENVIPYYKCYFNTTDGDGNKIYNTFAVGDLAYCETFNLIKSASGETHIDEDIANNHFFWRKVVAVGTDFVSLSNIDGEYAAESDIPLVGDNVTLLGNITDTERQNAIVLAGAGPGNPFLRLYTGINSFSLPVPDVQISPNGSWITVKDKQGTDVKISELINSLENEIELVKEQEDKQIVLWFGDTTPTLSNEPAVDWDTSAIRESHLKDIYYHRGAGLAYSFEYNNNVYGWELLTDRDVLESLQRANAAQDTADGKRRVFVDVPTPPYDNGDLWVNAKFPTTITEGGQTTNVPPSGSYTVDGKTYTLENPLYNNDVLRCKTSKASGSFSIDDWVSAQYYTRNNVDSKISVTASEIRSEVSDLETEINSTISQTADNITATITNGLNSTGIDISHGKITLNAEKTIVSDDLVVKRLETKPVGQDDDNQARIVAEGSVMEVYGSSGHMNIQFGVDENGYAILRYFDNKGNLLYDLGPNGLNYTSLQGEYFDDEDYVPISNVTEYKKEGTSANQRTYYLYHAKRMAGTIIGGNYTNNDAELARSADSKWFTTESFVSGGAIDTTTFVSGTFRTTTSKLHQISDMEEKDENSVKALLASWGVTQAEIDEIDFSITDEATKRLVYPIHYRQYYVFSGGVRELKTYVWQDTYKDG